MDNLFMDIVSRSCVKRVQVVLVTIRLYMVLHYVKIQIIPTWKDVIARIALEYGLYFMDQHNMVL